MAAPITTSQDSPDSIPFQNYSIDQLVDYCIRKLSGGIFTVELGRQEIIDIARDSLQKYSIWRPQIRYGTVALVVNQHNYLVGVDLGLGPAAVYFVQRTPIPQALFWGNLIDVAPLMQTGMDNYDTYLRWQKTWMRVTSVEPQWTYDQITKTLMIHNPIGWWHCGVVAFMNYTDVKDLDFFGCDWVKQYTYQNARLQLAETLSKYNGMIPGPDRDLQLDQGKRDRAEEKIKELNTLLFASQISVPMNID